MITQQEIAEIGKPTTKKEAEQMLLKQGKKGGVRLAVVGAQILARLKHAQKFPTLSLRPGFYFPLPTALEQSSSEHTAFIKSQLISKGTIGVDGTGGFGIDALYMSTQFERYNVCEIREDLVEIQRYNAKLLHKSVLKISQSSLDDFLPLFPSIDLLYIDPDRRIQNKRSWSLQDSAPDILKNHASYLKCAKSIMYKLSPMLDLAYLLQSFTHIESMHIIGVQGECKELVLVISREHTAEKPPEFWIHNIRNHQWYKKPITPQSPVYQDIDKTPHFIFVQDAIANKAKYYWQEIDTLYPIASGVYFSSSIAEETTPWGRWFRVIEFSNYNKKKLKAWTKERLELICINTPFSTEHYRKIWKIPPGNNMRFLLIIGTKEGIKCSLCERIKPSL